MVVRAGAGDWIDGGAFLILCSQVGSSVTSSNFRSTSSLSNLRRLLMIVSSPWPTWGSEASTRYPQLGYRHIDSASLSKMQFISEYETMIVDSVPHCLGRAAAGAAARGAGAA